MSVLVKILGLSFSSVKNLNTAAFDMKHKILSDIVPRTKNREYSIQPNY